MLPPTKSGFKAFVYICYENISIPIPTSHWTPPNLSCPNLPVSVTSCGSSSCSIVPSHKSTAPLYNTRLTQRSMAKLQTLLEASLSIQFGLFCKSQTLPSNIDMKEQISYVNMDRLALLLTYWFPIFSLKLKSLVFDRFHYHMLSNIELVLFFSPNI